MLKKHFISSGVAFAILTIVFTVSATMVFAAANLSSWADTKNKTAIQRFVKSVTDPASKNFVAPEQRLAVFDNDGTLMCERPMYTQIMFEIFWLNKQSEKNPELLKQPIYAAAAKNDLKPFFENTASYQKAVSDLHTAHTGTTNTAYKADVAEFFKTAQHPRFKIPYTECVYKPMLELINYLKQNDFNVFVCSGSEQEFLRGFTQNTYGISVANTIGTYVELNPEIENGKLVLKRGKTILHNNDLNKAVGIETFAGTRPIFVAGNSDGDLGMMRFAKESGKPYMCVLVCHDDAVREYDYTHGAEQAQKEVKKNNWISVSIQNDWATVF